MITAEHLALSYLNDILGLSLYEIGEVIAAQDDDWDGS